MAGVCVLSLPLLFLLVLWTPPVQSHLDGGKHVCENANNTACNKELALIDGGLIFVKLVFHGKVEDVTVNVSHVDCYECPAPPLFECSGKDHESPVIITSNSTLNCAGDEHIKPTSPCMEPALSDWDSGKHKYALYRIKSVGVYRVSVSITGEGTDNPQNISITLSNWYGYLDAADYPAMVFYSLLLVVYVFLAVVWSVLLYCSYSNLIRLQSIIAAVILLGLVEKVIFVVEYAVVNVDGISFKDYPVYLVLAEGVSALKNTFVRVLFILVSLGYGTVIARLGGRLKWIILFGVAYFAAASLYGLVRAFCHKTREDFSPRVLGAFIPQLVLEVILVFWIVTAVVKTLRTPKPLHTIRQLAFIVFLCSIVLTVIGMVAFCLWIYFGDFGCEDLQSKWMKECCWNAFLTALLIVVMILWRPSTNPEPTDYSQVNQEEEEEMEQKVNKNLETMTKRQKNKEEDVVWERNMKPE